MLRAIYQNKFLRDMEIAKKRKKDMAKLEEMMNKLLAGSKLFSRAQNHRLKGGFAGCWECHIEPDWLLVYEKTPDAIIFLRTGTHSDLF